MSGKSKEMMPQQVYSRYREQRIIANPSLRRRYYKECYVSGIDREDAIRGETENATKYMDWWKGNRFHKNRPVLIQDDSDDEKSVLSNEPMMDCCEQGTEEDFEKIQYPYIISQQPDLKKLKASMLSILHEEIYVKPENNPKFLFLLSQLESIYKTKQIDARFEKRFHDATWLAHINAGLQESLGTNCNGDHKYTLGRMSFDMFCPTQLVCSVQWTFNTVMSLNGYQCNQSTRPIPCNIRKGFLQNGREKHLRHYDISTAFTVEPENFCQNGQRTKPIRGLMTTFGYILPHPTYPNRFTVWFTGGLLEEVVSKDHAVKPSEGWRRTFQDPGGKSLKRTGKKLAAKILLGAEISDQMNEIDGSLEYFFHRPIGGDGQQFIDVLYLDEDLRIIRGHRGTIYVATRMR